MIDPYFYLSHLVRNAKDKQRIIRSDFKRNEDFTWRKRKKIEKYKKIWIFRLIIKTNEGRNYE